MSHIMKDQTELAPCPFCGGKAMENQRGEIQCSVAVCRSVESMPADAWNSRPDLRRIKELEAALREIAAFGTVNTGCGFTCANMARDALAGQFNPTPTP